MLKWEATKIFSRLYHWNQRIKSFLMVYYIPVSVTLRSKMKGDMVASDKSFLQIQAELVQCVQCKYLCILAEIKVCKSIIFNDNNFRFFSTVSYMMGGCTYSLNDIENGMLRNNRRSMGTLYMKPFSSSDRR